MTFAIAPQTTHNYSLTGKIIPVNAQSGLALWAGTVKKLGRHPNHFKWWELWYKEGMEVYRKVTRINTYSHSHYVNNIIELESEFKKETIRNIRNQPGIYFNNFFTNLLTFNLDINSVFIKLFKAIQKPGVEINKRWLFVGDPQDFHSPSEANAFKYYTYLLTMFGFAGICIALKQRNKSLLVPGMVYLCFCFAHCITYMDLMYYYLKIPFLYMFTAYFIDAINYDIINLPLVKRQISTAFIFNGILIVFGMWLSITIILF